MENNNHCRWFNNAKVYFGVSCARIEGGQVASTHSTQVAAANSIQQSTKVNSGDDGFRLYEQLTIQLVIFASLFAGSEVWLRLTMS